MNLRNLQIFLAVTEEMNFTKAANKLYISQPAVSQAIKNLETELSVQVFIRDKQKGLLLTTIGKEIALLGNQMTEIELKIYELADQENNYARGQLKIGYFPAVSKNILPKLLAAYKKKHPQISVELYEGNSYQVKKWVRQRRLDIGIVASPFDGYDAISLVNDYMVAVIPPTLNLSDQESINLTTYQNDVIFCKEGQETLMRHVSEKEKNSIKGNLAVQTADSLISLVECGLGIGIISNFSLSSVSHNLSVKSLLPRVTREIGLITLSSNDSSLATKSFITLLKNNEQLLSSSYL